MDSCKYLVLCFVILFCKKSFCQRDNINVVFNNTYEYGKEYQLVLNSTVEYILEFEDPSGSFNNIIDEFPARVSISSEEVNRTYPVFITARQQKGILSWQLPLLVQTPSRTQEFKNISRTLCPNSNFFLEEKKSCRSQYFTEDQKSPILHLTTSNPIDQTVYLRVDLVHNFFLNLNEVYNTVVTPSEPQYYYYSFDHGSLEPMDVDALRVTRKHKCQLKLTESDKHLLQNFAETKKIDLGSLTNSKASPHYSAWDDAVRAVSDAILPRRQTLDETLQTVRIITNSDDDVCMTISIQNASCPVFDNEREILYEGYYETISTKGAITVKKRLFPEGFYVVFIVKSTDEDCTGHSDLTNSTSFFSWIQPEYGSLDDIVSNSKRVKKITFQMVPSISYSDYVLATTLFVGAFIMVYFVFLFGILCCSRRYNRSYLTMGTEASPDATTANQPSTADRPIPNMHSSVTISGTGPDSLIVHRSRYNDSDEISREIVTADLHLPDNGFADEGLINPSGTKNAVISPGGDAVSTISDRIVSPNGVTATLVSVVDDSDSSVDTDAQSDYSTLHDAVTEKDVFRLPAVLTLAHLAKKRPKLLESRSYLYMWHVLTVAVFYGLPVVQLVFTYQRVLNRTGNQDLCYYNFLCAHPLGFLSDFNHVFSNVGYVLLGILFMLLVWRRQMLQRARGISLDCGIPQHFGLFYAMGFSLIMEGILSASYHVCPNHSNFQFDTSFMYIMAVLIMVKIYQTRHPDINARAHATFIVLACIIFMGLIGVMYSNFYIWVGFTIIHIMACLALTFRIYYMGRFKLDCKGIYRSIKEWLLVDLCASPREAVRPKYVTRMVLLILANVANWALAAYGVYRHERDFASHLLSVLMGNSILYTFFYITMKLVHREKIAFYSWIFILSAFTCWISALYFFLNPSISWALTPAQSRSYNQHCILINFYDPHDVWHAVSAGAMFFSFLVLLTLDDGMSKIPRCKIPVF